MTESQKKASGTLQVERRTWDKEKYEQRARDRLDHGDEFVDGEKAKASVRDKEEFRCAVAGAAGPMGSARAFLQSRSTELDLERRAGKTQVLANETMHKKGGGYWCDVCECLLRDSVGYLDHINGKKHQRKLGYSMRVERSDVSSVQARFALHKRAREDDAARPQLSAAESYAAKLVAQDEAAAEGAAEAKRARQEERATKRAEREAEREQFLDNDVAAMMGFGGFGGSKKQG